MRHGSANSYVNHGCRCDECRSAWNRYTTTRREIRRQRLAADPTLARHGTSATYCNWGCRCPACTVAHRIVRRELLAAQRSRR